MTTKRKPHYHIDDSKSLKPLDGYFILPLGVESNKNNESYFYHASTWKKSSNKDTRQLTGSNYTYCAPIKSNIDLYNEMEISETEPINYLGDKVFLPDKNIKINAPHGYYLLSENDIVKDGDMGLVLGTWCKLVSLERSVINHSKEFSASEIKAYCRPLPKGTPIELSVINYLGEKVFIPEGYVEPKEGYYLLGENELLQDGDLGYIDGRWTFNISLTVHGERATTKDNYDFFKDALLAKSIAFCRKIPEGEKKNQLKDKNMKTKTVDYNKFVNFVVNIVNPDHITVINALAKKYKFKLRHNSLSDISRQIFFHRNKIDSSSELEYTASINRIWNPTDETAFAAYNSNEIDAIINHLKAPIPKPPFKLHGYDINCYYTNEIVSFGCANISTTLLRNMFCGYTGNRTVSSITLSSGKVITAEQAKEILEIYDSNRPKK